jgi:hypothetical protein
MQYRSRCNIFKSFRNTLIFRYIDKGIIVKISANIAFLFYKEIYMKLEPIGSFYNQVNDTGSWEPLVFPFKINSNKFVKTSYIQSLYCDV